MTDSNLVGTSFAGTNTKDLKLQLYIESDDGTKIEGIGGENTKVKEIHLPVYKASEKQAEYEDGYVYVNSGNVYDFTLNELQNYESYLKTSAGYPVCENFMQVHLLLHGKRSAIHCTDKHLSTTAL